MNKVGFFITGLMLLSVITTEVFSQGSIFGNGDSRSQTQKISPPPKVLTPEEFRNTVQTLSDKNRSQLQNETSKLLPKVVAPKATTDASSSPATVSTPASTSPLDDSTTAKTQAPATSSSPAPSTEQSSASEESVDRAPSSSQPSTKKPYTGFNADGQMNSGTNATSNGGWNIKY